MNWSEIALAAIGAIAAAVAGGLVFKKISNNRSKTQSSVRIVSQKNNSAGGDIVAGDSTKTNVKR